MKAIIYILNAILSLAVGTFMLRFAMQLVRADFRNPVANVILKFTNPIILPLRKFVPPIRKIDTATILSCLLASLLMVCIMLLVTPFPLQTINPVSFTILVFKNALSIILGLYSILVLLSVLLSWFAPHGNAPFADTIKQLTDPLLNPVRKIIPDLGGLDISPVPVLILIGALQYQFRVQWLY